MIDHARPLRHRRVRVAEGRHRQEHAGPRAWRSGRRRRAQGQNRRPRSPASRRSWSGSGSATRTAPQPAITVEGFDTAAEAIASAEEDELLIIDAPADANRGTLEIAQAATLIVQPSGASIDDLRPAVLLFHELVQAGIPRERLVIALCRILSDAEEARWRARYIETAGYDVLPGCIPERTAYREAHNRGQAVTETKHQALNARVDELMEGLYTRVVAATEAQTEAQEISASQEEGMPHEPAMTMWARRSAPGWARPNSSAEPPQPERGDRESQPCRAGATAPASDEALTQLNFKIPHA